MLLSRCQQHREHLYTETLCDTNAELGNGEDGALVSFRDTVFLNRNSEFLERDITNPITKGSIIPIQPKQPSGAFFIAQMSKKDRKVANGSYGVFQCLLSDFWWFCFGSTQQKVAQPV